MKKIICLIILGIITTFSQEYSKEGIIDQMVSGEENGIYSVDFRLSGSKQYYSWIYKDTSNLDLIIDTTKWFRKVWAGEKTIRITHDENYKVTSFAIKPPKNFSTRSLTRKKKKRYWKQPESVETAYNIGDTVLSGRKFTSLINENMWKPSNAPNYWKQVDEEFFYVVYKKPTGAHDCYNPGFLVMHSDKKLYESTIYGNVWSVEEYPAGWKLYKHNDTSSVETPAFPEVDTSQGIPNYTQPTGAHDAYKRGDLVSLDGTTYRSIIDANVWSPAVARAYWEIVSGTRGTAEWKKPTGVHDCYHKGYKVTFNGKTYESLMSSNVWSPEELPSSWKVVE